MNKILSDIRIFLLPVTFLLLAGACGSKKTTLTGNSHIIESVNTQATTITHTDSAAFYHLSQTEQKNIDAEDYGQKIRIEFDTEKPVNEATNLPPVQSVEIITKGQKTSDKSAKTTEQGNLVNYDNATVDELNSRISIDQTEKTVEKVTKKESQFIKWIAVTAVAIAIIFICIVIRKATKGTGLITWIKNLFRTKK
ncbi:MAG: hypothetical protein LBJ63_02880 [Prevotellaceae bacterium]|jgi:preprotein translocase subunit SecF|nr:hypothetical protein [Prevotellaceae bacterium]